MSEDVALEKKLLNNEYISKESLRNELTSHDDESDVLENKLNDSIKKYKEIVELYNAEVFEFDEENEIFKISDNFKAKNEYLYCLYCMENKFRNNEDTLLFEKITAEAIKKYLGKNSQYKLIDNQQDQVSIEEICQKDLSEQAQNNADEKFRNDNPRCDIISWKKIDNRKGKLIILTQCKSGKKWKDGDPVNLRLWTESLINFTSPPIIAYAITDLLSDEEITRYSKEKGLIFDRVRIISLLADASNCILSNLRNKIESKIKNL